MMRKPEQKLWDKMRKEKPRGFYLERVENGLGAGMPDIYCKWQGGHCWVELKAPNIPKRKSTRLLGNAGLNQSQINWHLQHSALKLSSWILIRTVDRKILYLVRGIHAESVNNWPADDLYKWEWNIDLHLRGNLCRELATDNWACIFKRIKKA